MSKAILVIDMPQVCFVCPCSFTFGSPPHNVCEAMNDKSLTKENMNNTKPNWCPLKPLPQKKGQKKEIPADSLFPMLDGIAVLMDGVNAEYNEGWNDCMDVILGEEE